MNIQPMIDELLLIRRGLGKVGYHQGTFGRKDISHPCGTICCLAGIARFKEVGRRYMQGEDIVRLRAGIRMLGINPGMTMYPIFSSGGAWPHLLRMKLWEATTEQERIDAAICALRLMDENGGFTFRNKPVSIYKQKKAIAQRLAEVAQEEQELSELSKLLKEVELEIKSPETDRKLLRKDKDRAKKSFPKSAGIGRKRVAVQHAGKAK